MKHVNMTRLIGKPTENVTRADETLYRLLAGLPEVRDLRLVGEDDEPTKCDTSDLDAIFVTL